MAVLRILSLAAAAAFWAGCSGGEIREPEPERGAEGPGRVGTRPIAEGPTGPVVADELVLATRAGFSADEVAAAAAAAGAEVVWRGPRTGRTLVRVDGAIEAAREALAASPAIASVEPHRVVEGSGIATTPSVALQWHLPAAGLHPERGWGDASGVVVAVLDTGVAYESYTDGAGSYVLAPDLAGVSFVAGYDFVHDDPHPNDDHGHGTHIASILAGDGGELAAVAPGVEILPVKVLDADNLGSELALAEGILLAVDSGADVLNLSLSLSPKAFPSRFLQEAVREASDRGAILVASVGNQGAGVVTYPAAFREVIAVGASSLGDGFQIANDSDPWKHAARALELAPYSNRGPLVDVTAPGGVIEGDRDGDEQPEAILGQSFLGDPAAIEYVYYAGTSQAAAVVSGLVAVLAQGDPSLSSRAARALLGETARQDGLPSAPLSDAGRGYLRGDRALARPLTSLGPDPATYVAIAIERLSEPGAEVVRAEVEVLDEDGRPVRKAEVYGAFTGGVFEGVRGETDRDGRVAFTSSAPASLGPVVGFQVEAVASRANGHRVDRPRGFVRIDSCSLELLSRFAAELDDGVAGQGIATTPGAPLGLVAPAEAGVESSVLLLNYSWALATVPLAVAVEPSWLSAAYDDADLVTLASSGTGVGDRPVAVDPAAVPSVEVDAPLCLDLIVRSGTAGSGIATTPSAVPIRPDPAGNCAEEDRCGAYQELLAALWTGTAGAWDSASGVSAEMHAHLASLVEHHGATGVSRFTAPASDYGEVLEAAGMGLTPLADAAGQGAGGAPLND